MIRVESRALRHGLTSGLGLVLVLLPGLTVGEAAAGRATLIATIVAATAGAVVLVPSLAVLYSLVLRGRLDTAEAAPADGDASAVAARLGAPGGWDPGGRRRSWRW